MLTRRQLVTRSGAAGAAVVLAPQAARAKVFRGGRFDQGVLSGDPTPHGITLLTLIDHVGGRGSVRLEVPRDPHFRHVVAHKTVATSAAHNHSVKARVEGLKAHERYWYRFETRGEHSPVGRFQTALPHAGHALAVRPLPDRLAAGLAPAGEVRVLLVRGLHARLLQRLPADGARGRRLRRLPRRLHLR